MVEELKIGAAQPPTVPAAAGELSLTALDDYPFHQAMAPFPVPSSADPRFNDGYYFGFFSRGQFAHFGLRLHPNNNVMDGFAGAIAHGEQRVVRASRALRPDTDTLAVGPLRMTVLEPMLKQRLQLDENPTGITFDVTIDARSPAFFESPDIHYRRGRLLNHVLRYTQLGRAHGTMTVDGEEIVIDDWYSDRDHSWGLRASMGPKIPIKGVEPSRGDPRAIRIWMPFDLGDRFGMFSTHEDSDGNRIDFDGHLHGPGERHVELVDVEHSLRYLEGTRRLLGGEFTLTDAEGARHGYEVEVVADPACAQGFGYVRGWQDGDQPGTWRGAEYIESDRFRVDDPNEIAGPPHVPIERRLGVCEYPTVVRGPEGRTGMAQIEHMVYKPYRPYGLK
ncbi:MAG: hypothetical protein ACRDPE_07510 [Solirubrobacterales bacterium]